MCSHFRAVIFRAQCVQLISRKPLYARRRGINLSRTPPWPQTVDTLSNTFNPTDQAPTPAPGTTYLSSAPPTYPLQGPAHLSAQYTLTLTAPAAVEAAHRCTVSASETAEAADFGCSRGESSISAAAEAEALVRTETVRSAGMLQARETRRR